MLSDGGGRAFFSRLARVLSRPASLVVRLCARCGEGFLIGSGGLRGLGRDGLARAPGAGAVGGDRGEVEAAGRPAASVSVASS